MCAGSSVILTACSSRTCSRLTAGGCRAVSWSRTNRSRTVRPTMKRPGLRTPSSRVGRAGPAPPALRETRDPPARPLVLRMRSYGRLRLRGAREPGDDPDRGAAQRSGPPVGFALLRGAPGTGAPGPIGGRRRPASHPAGRNALRAGFGRARHPGVRQLPRARRPYDPATGQGTVGRSYAYQTMAAVNVFYPESIRINPFMGAGALGTVIDDYNGDNADHSGLGFVGGGIFRPAPRALARSSTIRCLPALRAGVSRGSRRYGGTMTRRSVSASSAIPRCSPSSPACSRSGANGRGPGRPAVGERLPG